MGCRARRDRQPRHRGARPALPQPWRGRRRHGAGAGRECGGDRRRRRAAPRRLFAALGLPRPLHRQGPVRAADGRNAGQADHPPAAGPVWRRRRLREGTWMPTDELMRLAPVIPVLVLEEEMDWAALAETFVAAGLPVLEITLRTPVALEAIRQMSRVPGAVVGAGTVLNELQLAQAIDAGSRFIVSPGLTNPLALAARDTEIALLPGVATAGHIMRGLDLGLDRFKFFPAEASGGIAALNALSAPFLNCRFCP